MSEEQQNGQQQGEDLAERVYDPPEEFASQANIQDPDIWDKAAEDYEGFWESWAKELHWFKEWDQVLTGTRPLPSGSSAARSTRPTTAWTTRSSKAGVTSRRSSGSATSLISSRPTPTTSSSPR